MLIRVTLGLFALLLLGLAYYLLTHRRTRFLLLEPVPPAVSRQLAVLAVCLIGAAILAEIAAVTTNLTLAMVAVIVAAAITGYLGLKIGQWIR